jgi:hypothetical protein
MTDDEELDAEQMQYLQGLIADIQKLGPTAFLAQYCNWANLHVETINDTGRGATLMRAEQVTVLVWFLKDLVKDEDTTLIVTKLKDSVVRALFNAKLNGREKIGLEDAEEAMNWITDEFRAIRENPDG